MACCAVRPKCGSVQLSPAVLCCATPCCSALRSAMHRETRASTTASVCSSVPGASSVLPSGGSTQHSRICTLGEGRDQMGWERVGAQGGICARACMPVLGRVGGRPTATILLICTLGSEQKRVGKQIGWAAHACPPACLHTGCDEEGRACLAQVSSSVTFRAVNTGCFDIQAGSGEAACSAW